MIILNKCLNHWTHPLTIYSYNLYIVLFCKKSYNSPNLSYQIKPNMSIIFIKIYFLSIHLKILNKSQQFIINKNQK